jgi:hypothetical protein
MASSPDDLDLRNDAMQLRGMFWTLNIDPPEAERFICILVLEVWYFII